MNIETEPHHLVGLADPVGKCMGFLIPVFSRKGSNALRVERIDSEKRVEAFIDLEPQETPTISAPNRESYIGAPHHWAFGFGTGDIILGQGEEGRDKLRSRLNDPFFSDQPLMAIEVAEFLNLRDDRLRFARIAAQWLKQIGSTSADRWCDLSILTPDIRDALGRVISTQSSNGLDPSVERVTVRVQEDVVQVRGLEKERHATNIDQITAQIRNTLGELHALYPAPTNGWKVQLIGARSTAESAPRGYDLEAVSALVYIADGDTSGLRRMFSKHLEGGIGLYPPRQQQEFLRQSSEFRGTSFVLLKLDPELGPVLPQLKARKLRPIGLAMRTSTAPRLSPSELAALDRYPHPTVVVNVRDTAMRGLGLVGEVRDAVHILGSVPTRSLLRQLPARTNYFLRARGLGINRTDDAWAQIYGRCIQLGLAQSAGLRFHIDHRFAAGERESRLLGDMLLPRLQVVKTTLSREEDRRSAVDAAVLLAGREPRDEQTSRRDWQLYSGSVKQLLEAQGWSISGSLDPMDAAMLVGRRRFDLSTTMEDRRRRTLYPFEALLDQNLSDIKRITVTENASMGAILTSLMEGRELLATVRDLCAFSAEDGTIWTLLASQMRRFVSSLPTRTRSYYFATLCQAAVQRDRIDLEGADRLVQAWHHPSFGEAIHMLCTGVRYERKKAIATLRLAPALQSFGPARFPREFPIGPEELRFELVLTRDGSAVRRTQRAKT